MRSRVEGYFTRYAFPQVRRTTKVKLAELGNDAGIYGADSIMFDLEDAVVLHLQLITNDRRCVWPIIGGQHLFLVEKRLQSAELCHFVENVVYFKS